MAILAISSTDPKQHEAASYEVCDAFFQISKLTSAMILGMLMLRHQRDKVEAAAAAEVSHNQ
jgi:hypothetical protein